MTKQIKRRVVDLSKCRFNSDKPQLIQRIYAARGVESDDDIVRELNGLLPASKLKGLTAGLELLVWALQESKSILIVGDFDADGATSTALAISAFRKFGHDQVDYLVPNRFEYGYGLTPEIVAVAVAEKNHPDLIMTVDNGIASLQGVQAAQESGIKVLVTDHHLPGSELPTAEAIVNPNQPNCEFPSKNLAGVGVVFYLMVALRTRLRELQWFEQNKIPEPNMGEFLDLVALGTVADVVPLDSNNRLLVHQGIGRIRKGKARVGIKALAELANRSIEGLQASDMGFAIGPRLNAAGRLDDMSLGIECLLATDYNRAKEMAYELDSLNKERKNIESSMQTEALQELKKVTLGDDSSVPFGIAIYDATWHQGVVGILASRIKERFHRPVIAFAQADEKTIKGSARSVPGFHIRDALDAIATRHPGLIDKFGGHAMAAGLSLPLDNFGLFKEAFAKEAERLLTKEDLEQIIMSDGELLPQEFTLDTAKIIAANGPWGQAFPEPTFDGRFDLLEQRIVGSNHLKLVLGIQGTNQIVDGIAFNVDLEHWPNRQATSAQLAYRLDINEFRGRQSVQLMVEHLEPY